MIIKKIRIDAKNDPSVGLMPSFWELTGDIFIDTCDELDELENQLKKLYEVITDFPVTISFEFEKQIKPL